MVPLSMMASARGGLFPLPRALSASRARGMSSPLSVCASSADAAGPRALARARAAAGPSEGLSARRAPVGRRGSVAAAAAADVSSPSSEDDPPAQISNGPVARAERAFNTFAVELVVKLLDVMYEGQTYPRFYVLETIARVPYFAYMSVLHLYESLGWWRRADYISVHFAETWNELHHLLIMESLGGDKKWFDRFFAQHTAVFYFWVTCAMYLASPRMAYHFMELVESHAYDTYDKFVKEFGEELKLQPAPKIAKDYYGGGALYMFDEFQTQRTPEERRPVINTLYDVFVAVRDDEAEHTKTMRACQTLGAIQSPHMSGSSYTLSSLDDVPTEAAACAGVVDCAVRYTTGYRGDDEGGSVDVPAPPLAVFGEDGAEEGGAGAVKEEGVAK
mmetsp:Transcript_11707/g.37190  ORF Transcript_11707/g.37190 Transcript_11707/m.37190 type:complete len:390 (+) Transcript_11707:48-1217(+)